MKRHIPLFRVTLPARAQFPIDDKLVSRQIEKAKSCPVNSIKRVIFGDQPEYVSEWSFDANGSPV